MTLGNAVIAHIEKSKSSDASICLMSSDPDSLGAAFVALFLIK
jgi:hypothetical protein